MEADDKLPDGWIKVESKSKAGKFYYFHKKFGSVWKIEDVKKFKPKDKATRDKKTTKKEPDNPPKKIAATSKAIKKNGAKDRLESLQKKLKAELKALDKGPKPSPGLKQRADHLDVLNDAIKLCSAKTPKSDVKNGAQQRMAKIRKQQKTEQEYQPKVKEENNNHVQVEQKAEPVRDTSREDLSSISDVDMMDISFEEEPVQSQPLSEYESMEWEDIPEQEVIDHVHKVRSTASAEQASPELPKSSLPNADVDFFVVVDTNVLLSNIDFIKQIKGKMFKDIGKATIYLPYIVLRELDHLKSNTSVERQARRAIAFIDDCFKSRDAFVLGQSAVENRQKKIIPIDGGDDEILNGCLLLQETTKKIVLLTNDKNLRNKAFVNKLESYSRDMLYSTEFNIKNQIKFE